MMFIFKRHVDEFAWPDPIHEPTKVYAIDAETVTTVPGDGRIEIGYLAQVWPGDVISGRLMQADECVVSIPQG